ncbi:uncharacterized protein Aud_010232 [Aspergillus udagawae]|uniref:Demethylsterigmatocystin 6-O-methyltransferase n=1 Tax=Aspergillus udagawae TaxID=91492 RepID=A0A8E0QYP3_9EURO|nr:uncharacterized protein Aud_010232 [Aspergillus udagawae]GIC93744.1 hypothetical protein Aud_010232 [Aspergillus udagawae]
MSAMASQYPHAGFYDFSWVVSEAAEDEERPLIVDIGGSKGWTLQAICREIPEIPISRCVLQDLPRVIEMVETVGSEDIRSAQLMAIDFNKEQPVKGTLRPRVPNPGKPVGLGALVYMIRRILRGFEDDECHGAAQQAIDCGYGHGESSPWFPAMLDFFLSTIGSKERTEEGFRKITARAGLKVTGMHYSDKAEFAMVECEKA